MITHRQHYLKSIGKDPNKSYSIKELSAFSGVPVSILQEVYNRGTGAYGNLASVRLKSNFSKNPNTTKYPASMRLTKEQWSYARVYSFLDKGTTYKTTDSDLAKKGGY